MTHGVAREGGHASCMQPSTPRNGLCWPLGLSVPLFLLNVYRSLPFA